MQRYFTTSRDDADAFETLLDSVYAAGGKLRLILRSTPGYR